MSGAFDTIAHGVLLLKYAFGLKDDALALMRSYLTGHKQCVVINRTLSTTNILEFGFHQGSVVGQRNWTRYSAPIGVISRKHGLSFHLYADDTQCHF